ncbi:large ribosomal subunit protein bL17m [Halyomorpha halys]|uniref:large ribosomal subunit protein bL17m n=1 Tax=Halyomorpha halys TaxID=286706 RepID=UPI0006D506A8|nr:39S ribosomal protein L17, mitochondrial [Halyomorpha halys]
MNQADVSKLVSKLRINIRPRHYNLKNPKGPEGRLEKLRIVVTGLIKHERIQLNYRTADEARGYAERLISEAIRHGDCHTPTMEIADYWLTEKQLLHKLFKVLVPRFHECNMSYTRLLRVSSDQDQTFPQGVLELRGNPYPPLTKDLSHNRNLLHNVLLDAARKDYRHEQYLRIAQGMSSEGKKSNEETHTANIEEKDKNEKA